VYKVIGVFIHGQIQATAGCPPRIAPRAGAHTNKGQQPGAVAYYHPSADNPVNGVIGFSTSLCAGRQGLWTCPSNLHSTSISLLSLQLQSVDSIGRCTLLLCAPPEMWRAHLPAAPAALVLMGVLDVTLAELRACRGLDLTTADTIMSGKVATATKIASKVVQRLITEHPDLRRKVAACLVEEERLLHWFWCLEGMRGAAAVEVVSLLAAGVTEDAPGGGAVVPGGMGLTPSEAAEVRLGSRGNGGQVAGNNAGRHL
jgi:hypothetical protein